ncbi:hypothetical protein HNR19_000077 [Nocardioides thalensis]|uniref:DUF2510 domain-containing protein n=1 Tax=Nocardioides thalensis TaxID=1914755 RepID=A0A853BVS2_9ACTN|nr:hypothetical protein [Nocardioides thalensis]
MTSPGWYPDPAGQPNAYRYWNGQAWTQDVTYGQAGPGQGYGAPVPPTPPPPPPGAKGGAGKVVALVVAGVVLLAALGTGAFFLVRSLADDGDETASDDTSESVEPTESETGATDDTPSPTESTETAEPTDDETSGGIDVGPTREQCSGGAPDPGRLQASASTLTGGGLTIPSLTDQGYSPDASVALAFTWADSYQVSYKVIESAGESWIANYGVGALPRANGFESPQQAAEVVLQCMTSSDMYQGYSGTTDLDVGPVTVDGHDAYSILTEVRVDNPDVQAEGDVAQVVVVDTGDPESYGLYISVVPIGDQAEINRQAQVFDQIDVR